MRLERLMHSMSLAAGNSPPRFTGALQAPKVPILGGISEAQRAAAAARTARKAARAGGGGGASRKTPRALFATNTDVADNALDKWIGDDFSQRQKEGHIRLTQGNMRGGLAKPISGAGIIADIHRTTDADFFMGTETSLRARQADMLRTALKGGNSHTCLVATDGHNGDNRNTGTAITFPPSWANECSGGGDAARTIPPPKWDKHADAAQEGRACVLRVQNAYGIPGILLVCVYAPQRTQNHKVDVLWNWLVWKTRVYIAPGGK